MGAPDFRAPAAGFEFENAQVFLSVEKTLRKITKFLQTSFCKKPTAPCVPRRSPIQVLTGLNAA